MYEDINCCHKCPQCVFVSGSGKHTKPPLHPIPVSKPFQIVDVAELEIALSHWPFSDQFSPIRPSKSTLLGHLYCTFPMEKPLIIYSNVPAFKEWPTNFKLLFQALV